MLNPSRPSRNCQVRRRYCAVNTPLFMLRAPRGARRTGSPQCDRRFQQALPQQRVRRALRVPGIQGPRSSFYAATRAGEPVACKTGIRLARAILPTNSRTRSYSSSGSSSQLPRRHDRGKAPHASEPRFAGASVAPGAALPWSSSHSSSDNRVRPLGNGGSWQSSVLSA